MFGGLAVDGCGGHGATGTTVGEWPSSTAHRSGSQRKRTSPSSAAKTSKNVKTSGSTSRRRQAMAGLRPGSAILPLPLNSHRTCDAGGVLRSGRNADVQ